jgi:prepilin peptidase CpaA
LLSYLPDGLGWVDASLGFLTGLAVYLPFYLMRVLGAGDVKLLATVGIFVGYPGILIVAVFSALAGGVLALALAAYTGRMREMVAQVHQTVVSQFIQMHSSQRMQPFGVATHSVQMPYALAIAIGTLAHAAWPRA